MTQTVTIDEKSVEIATKKELLDFANKIREAGGADVLEALIPSEPASSRQCLIANALNFGCEVAPKGDCWGEWLMYLPDSMSETQRTAIHKATGCPVTQRWPGWELTLPEHIGYAALAFDEGVAFTDLVLDY